MQDVQLFGEVQDEHRFGQEEQELKLAKEPAGQVFRHCPKDRKVLLTHDEQFCGPLQVWQGELH
jgi:hypothetical protein